MTEPSITVTPARLSFVLALTTAIGIAWSVVTYVNDQDHRLANVETHVTEQRQINRDLLTEIKALTISVTRLTTVMETMTRQASTTTQIKAEIEPETMKGAGVGRSWAPSAPNRPPSTTRDRLDLAISGAPE